MVFRSRIITIYNRQIKTERMSEIKKNLIREMNAGANELLQVIYSLFHTNANVVIQFFSLFFSQYFVVITNLHDN